MRVSPHELKGVRQGGMLARYAVLGPAAFVLADFDEHGSSGTSTEDPCEQEHWGMVLDGEFRLDGPGAHEFGPGTAFYVPPGPPAHRFRASPRSVVAGFVPIREPLDDSPAALEARGLEVVQRVPLPSAPPEHIRVTGMPSRLETRGAIEVETADMGEWVFSRTTFGPVSGFTSGWCDLTHWGIVLAGDLVLRWEHSLELLGPGDVFYCPPGPPGHQFEVADAATIIDYTPLEDLESSRRVAAWRTALLRPRRPSGSVSRGRTPSASEPASSDRPPSAVRPTVFGRLPERHRYGGRRPPRS